MADRTQSGFRFHHVSSFVFLALFFHGHSLRLPSSAPPEFHNGDSMMVKVNNLASSKTQIPYSYYSMPYCQPQKIVDSDRNRWEVIRGDHIQNSPYVFRMRVQMMCEIVCRIKLNKKTATELKEKIDDEYRVNMILENLPLVVPIQLRTQCDSPITYQHGYFVGSKLQDPVTNEDKYFINNHLSFVVKYHEDIETSTSRVVGFEVKASSINHKFDYSNWGARLSTCDPHANHLVTSSASPQEIDDTKDIIFTYDVEYQRSDVKWSSTCDTYIPMANNQIHRLDWGHEAVIVLRTLHQLIKERFLKLWGQN